MSEIDNRRRDSEGRVIVDMFVKDDTDFLSTFSKMNARVISSDVATFIENSVQNVKPKEALSLHVYGDCIDEQERVLYNDGIHRYYADAYQSVKREYKRNVFVSMLLALLGFVLIGLSIIIGNMGKPVWMEAIDIVAWVFVWEAVDILVFKNRELRINKLRYLSLSQMKVEFYLTKEESQVK